MNTTNSLLCVALLALLSVASAQVNPCVSAGDCEQSAFAFAFTKDKDIDQVKVSDAVKIQADVRECFKPCAQSARHIAKLSIASGDNLFDERRQKAKSGRGRGRINKPSFGKDTAPGQNRNNGRGQTQTTDASPCASVSCPPSQKCVPTPKQCFTTPCPQYECQANGNSGNNTPAPNSRASLLNRFNAGRGRGGGRGKRDAVEEDPSVCLAGILGASPRKFMETCKLEQGASKNPDVEKLLQAAATRRPTAIKTATLPPATNFLNSFRSQLQNGANNAFGNLGGLFKSGTGNSFFSRGKRAAGKFKASKDKQGELLYMFAHAKDIAAQVCPDKKDEVMFCVHKASQNTIDFDNVDVNTVKARYCQAKQECTTRKAECERQLGEETKQQCDCVTEMKQKVGSKCPGALPPSPCDVQSDPPRKDTSGGVCTSDVPTAEEVVELVRKRNGGGRDKIRAAKLKKANERRG